jgi:hypothetical protein
MYVNDFPWNKSIKKKHIGEQKSHSSISSSKENMEIPTRWNKSEMALLLLLLVIIIKNVRKNVHA